MVLFNGINHFTHLFWRPLLIGVNWPEIKLFHVIIARQVRERAFTGDQPALIGGNFFQFGTQRIGHLANFRFIAFGILLIDLRIIRIVLHQGVANVIDINQRVFCRHPGVRVRFTVIRAFGNAHRFDTGGDDDFRYAGKVLIKAGEPSLQVQTIREDKLCPLRSFNIAGRWLILMDFSAGFGNRADFRCVARHVFRHVGNNGKRGDDFKFLFCIGWR